MFICVWCMCAHVEASIWPWVFSLITYHHMHWDRVPQENPELSGSTHRLATLLWGSAGVLPVLGSWTLVLTQQVFYLLGLTLNCFEVTIPQPSPPHSHPAIFPPCSSFLHASSRSATLLFSTSVLSQLALAHTVCVKCPVFTISKVQRMGPKDLCLTSWSRPLSFLLTRWHDYLWMNCLSFQRWWALGLGTWSPVFSPQTGSDIVPNVVKSCTLIFSDQSSIAGDYWWSFRKKDLWHPHMVSYNWVCGSWKIWQW